MTNQYAQKNIKRLIFGSNTNKLESKFSFCEKPICIKPMIKFDAFHKHSNHKKGSPNLKQKQEHETTICLVKAISNFKRQSFQQKNREYENRAS